MKKFWLAVACAAGLVAWAHGQEIRGDSDALRLVFDGPLVDLTLSPCDPVPAPLSAKALGGCAPPALSKDLVLYYPFDEDLGKLVRDASGNNRTGWVQGATWIHDGVRGGAVRFDDNQQTITATDAGLPSGNSPRTLAVWIKLDKLYPDGTTGLFSYGTWQWNRACGLGMDWRNERDQFYFTQNGGVALSRAKMEQAGVWRHLAYVYDGTGQHRLYVDGVPSDGMTELRGPLNTTLSGLLMLAGHPGSIGPDGGYLDEAMIFNRALSPGEVGAVYRGALPVDVVETAAGDCPRVITRIWMTKDALGGIRPPEPIPVEFAETSAGDCPRTITRVWTAKDRCGHVASARQTITIADRIPPALLGVPADLEVACGDEIPPPAAVTATDENPCNPGAGPELVLHYPFDRRHGRIAREDFVFDASGNGNHGQLHGARLVRDGFWGRAALFDGADDWIRVPSRPTLMPKEVTVAAWVNVQARPKDVAVLVHKRNASLHNNEDYVLQLTAAGRARWVLANSGRQTRLDSPVLETGKWHHVAATFARPAMKIYLDGKLVGTAAHDWPLAHNPDADLFLGASDHLANPMASFACGKLDDVRIYNKALSSEEVGALLGDASVPQPVPVELVETREGDCPGVVTRVWTATDRCGNAASATQTITVAAAALPPVLIGVPGDIQVECDAEIPPPAAVTAVASGTCRNDPSMVPSNSLDMGLIAYYPFNGNANDESGNGNHAAVYGAGLTQDRFGVAGSAYSFDGLDDYIDAGNSVGDNPSNLTYTAWVKLGARESYYRDTIITKRHLNDGTCPDTTDGSDAVSLCIGNWQQTGLALTAIDDHNYFAAAQGTGVIATNTWVFLAATRQGSAYKIYVNGILQGSRNDVHDMGGSTQNIHFMHHGAWGTYCNGDLDEVRIYNRELAPAEISALAGAIPVSLAETTNGICPTVVTRIWTATDACGNAASATQTITVADTTPPMLIGVPADLEVACGDEIPPPAAVTAMDAGSCGPAPIPGLVLHYPFDEDLGQIVRDASGGGRTGWVNGATWVPDGMRGGAFRFENVSQAITATDAGLPAGDASRSIALWAKLDQLPADTITGFLCYGTRLWNQMSGVGLDWRVGRANFYFTQCGGVALSQWRMAQAGAWHHLVYTYAGNGQHRFYVDGAPSDGMSELRGPINTVLSGSLVVGGPPEVAGPSGGCLDDVRIYNRALVPAEVDQLYRDMPAADPVPVELVETRAGDCPGVITRVWTATDRCGNAASATQTITVAGPVPTGDWHVATDGDDSAAGTSWATAKRTIQAAVDLAKAGETVWVSNGVYETGTRITPGYRLLNRVVITNDITVRSVNGPEATIIRGQGPRGSNAVRCVYLSAGKLIGFTVADGGTRLDGDNTYDCNSAGIMMYPSIVPIVSNCVISGNSGNTAAVAFGTLYNCTIRGNQGVFSAGGVGCSLLYNCLLEGNTADYYGGGADQSTLYNCTVTGNSAAYGGGVYNCKLYNCIVYSNTPANVAVATCRYTCTTPLQSGTGNLAADPQLLPGGHIAMTSPCLGKGSPAYALGTDIDGDAWRNPPAMGCDEPVGLLEPFALEAPAPVRGAMAFASAAGGLYTLQRCEDLRQGHWEAVPGCTRIPGTGGQLTLTDPDPGSAGFYRIAVETP